MHESGTFFAARAAFLTGRQKLCKFWRGSRKKINDKET